MASPSSHLSPKNSQMTTTPPLPNIDAGTTVRNVAFEDLTPNQKGELVALSTSRSSTVAERQKHLQYFTTTGKLRALFRPILNENDKQGNPLIPEDVARMHMQVASRSKDNAPVIEGAIPELEGIESTPRDKIHEVSAERTAMGDARAKIYALQSEPVDNDSENVTESDLDYAPTESGHSTFTESTLPFIPSTAGDALESVDEMGSGMMESNNTPSPQSATGDPLNQFEDLGDNWMLDDDIDIPSVSTESTHTRLLRARGADFFDLNGYAPTSGPSVPPYDLPVLPSDSNTHAHPTSSPNEMEQGEFRSLVDLDQQIQTAIDESTRAVLARQHENQIEAKNNLRRLIKDRDKVIKSLGEIAARHRAN